MHLHDFLPFTYFLYRKSKKGRQPAFDCLLYFFTLFILFLQLADHQMTQAQVGSWNTENKKWWHFKKSWRKSLKHWKWWQWKRKLWKYFVKQWRWQQKFWWELFQYFKWMSFSRSFTGVYCSMFNYIDLSFTHDSFLDIVLTSVSNIFVIEQI